MSLISLHKLNDFPTAKYSRDWSDAYTCLTMKDKIEFRFFVNRLIKPEIDYYELDYNLITMILSFSDDSNEYRKYNPRRAELLC